MALAQWGAWMMHCSMLRTHQHLDSDWYQPCFANVVQPAVSFGFIQVL
jgi:hypothetical protein